MLIEANPVIRSVKPFFDISVMKDTREHILKTAAKLFLQKTFKEVTMKEIVQATGMSKGAFYHHFSSKDQLFLEIVEQFFSWTNQNFDGFSEESLFEFYHQYLDYGRSFIPKLQEWFSTDNKKVSFNLYRLMFDAMDRYPGFREKLVQLQNVEMESWQNIISIARKKGEIKSLLNDEQLAKIFTLLPDGASLQGLIQDRFDTFQTEIRELYDGIYAELTS